MEGDRGLGVGAVGTVEALMGGTYGGVPKLVVPF